MQIGPRLAGDRVGVHADGVVRAGLDHVADIGGEAQRLACPVDPDRVKGASSTVILIFSTGVTR